MRANVALKALLVVNFFFSNHNPSPTSFYVPSIIKRFVYEQP